MAQVVDFACGNYFRRIIAVHPRRAPEGHLCRHGSLDIRAPSRVTYIPSLASASKIMAARISALGLFSGSKSSIRIVVVIQFTASGSCTSPPCLWHTSIDQTRLTGEEKSASSRPKFLGPLLSLAKNAGGAGIEVQGREKGHTVCTAQIPRSRIWQFQIDRPAHDLLPDRSMRLLNVSASRPCGATSETLPSFKNALVARVISLRTLLPAILCHLMF